MKAVQFHEFGNVDVLRLEDIFVPEPKSEAMPNMRSHLKIRS
jgi:hypothetical protein